jgi:hypothetical protein
VFVWVDRDPEAAFDRGALLFEVAEVSWDTTSILYNSAIDVLNAGVLPLWNAASHAIVEPSVILVLEIFSLVFTQQHYQGVFSEEDFPYFGLDCTASAEAAQWCGRYSYYAARLESAEKAPHFVDESQAYARRRLFDDHPEQQYTFGIDTSRRLSELTGTFVAQAFDTSDLTAALDDFSTTFITLGSIVADVVFGVATEVLQTSFSYIVDAIFIVFKSAMWVLKALVKSGMLSTLIGVGIDFFVIGAVEIALPMLFAGIDLIFCILDFFQPAGWLEQLKCIEATCFKGVDAVADMLVFWSMPVVLHRFTAVAEATLNSRTGKRFFQAMSGKGFSGVGRTTNPDTGETIDNAEPESAEFHNPMYEFEFADTFAEFLPTMGTDSCGACFVCK